MDRLASDDGGVQRSAALTPLSVWGDAGGGRRVVTSYVDQAVSDGVL